MVESREEIGRGLAFTRQRRHPSLPPPCARAERHGQCASRYGFPTSANCVATTKYLSLLHLSTVRPSSPPLPNAHTHTLVPCQLTWRSAGLNSPSFGRYPGSLTNPDVSSPHAIVPTPMPLGMSSLLLLFSMLLKRECGGRAEGVVGVAL